MTYDSIFTLRSVRIVTGGNNYQAHRFAIYASDDGAHFRFVRQLQPADRVGRTQMRKPLIQYLLPRHVIFSFAGRLGAVNRAVKTWTRLNGNPC